MIIAEIGLNHLGCARKATRLVKQLLLTPVEGITFQIREPEYYTTNPQYKLPDLFYKKIIELIKNSKKQFGVAIADINQIDFFESLDTDFYKVIRNDILNHNLITKLINTNKKLIVSTGTCSESDIRAFVTQFNTSNIILNHTQLSHHVEDCNLSAINTLKTQFNTKVSYGSHCINYRVLYMALCYHPSDILFYVKGNLEHNYPDNEHAIKIKQVKQIVTNLLQLKTAIGSGIKNEMEIKI